MGQGFAYEGQVLCEDCYRITVERKMHKEEIPPREEVEGNFCQKCGAPLTDIAEQAGTAL
jgi:hypothetical protein